MRLDAQSATAADFDAAAQKWANAFWGSAILAGIVWYFFGWGWALIPGASAAWSAIKSMGATLYGQNLRKGTYPLPNPNNGAPDGDARNR